MTEQEKLNDFIKECEQEKIKSNLKEGDYCMIVYSKKGYMASGKWVKFIYKSIDVFKEKAFKDMESIDSTYSVDLQMWIFD